MAVVVGTRPQIIKSQALVNQLTKDGLKVEVINTGQHYDFDMSDAFFQELGFKKPSVNLGIGQDTTLNQISKILLGLDSFFKKSNKQPDLVIVPGDTTSALASAIAVSRKGIPLAHLEAGARSNQFHMAEEINRRLIDHCSNYLFAPTKNCLNNLKSESVFGESFFTGDTMYDLFLLVNKREKLSQIKKETSRILVTIHRTENIEDSQTLETICSFLNKLNKLGYEIVFPLHPHTGRMLRKFKLKLSFKTVSPKGYLEMLKILASSEGVITDSGGLQKESYWMNTPCITLRHNTEWIETVSAKANHLLPASTKKLSPSKVDKIISSKVKPQKSLFGNGKASERISKIIQKM